MPSVLPPQTFSDDQPEAGRRRRTTEGDSESQRDRSDTASRSSSLTNGGDEDGEDHGVDDNHEEEYDDDDDDDDGTTISLATLIGSTANLCSATLGAGILALPYAFYQAGIVCGILLLLVSAWATFTSIELLAETYDGYRASTYEAAVERGLGRKFRTAVEISILVFCLGTAVGYVIAVGDILERIVEIPTPGRKRALMSLVWTVAMLPLSCLRTMKSLEVASSVGIASIGTLLVAAVVHALRTGSGGGGGVVDDDDDEAPSVASLLGPAGGSWVSVLRACPIFFYAFSSQVNVAQIFEELPSPPGGRGRSGGGNPRKIRAMRRVTLLGVTVCGSLYAGLSLVTLADFGDRIQPNVLSCYDLRSDDDGGRQPLLRAAFLGMALAVVIAFPLNIFPARVSLIQKMRNDDDDDDNDTTPPTASASDVEELRRPLLSRDAPTGSAGGGVRSGDRDDDDRSGDDDDNSNGDGDDPPRSASSEVVRPDGGSRDYRSETEEEEFRWTRHAVVTLLLAGSALGSALVVPNISVVFGLLGGTTSSLLGFVVPGLLGLRRDRRRIGAWILVVFGSLVGALTTGATVRSMMVGGSATAASSS